MTVFSPIRSAVTNELPARRRLALALAAALASAAPATSFAEGADTPAATEMDAVVVAGSRMQAKQEIDTRRQSPAIVDTLSADEIGAMPDLTIAESMRRIAGVTTVYNDDIGQFASIRGSHPDYVPVTISGLTIATTGDHGEGTRKVNLQVIPTNAVQQIRAFKTLAPSLDAGALAGLIDILPGSAFDAGQPLFGATLGTSYTSYMDVPDDNSAGRDNKESPFGRSARLSWAPTFADHTLGLLVTGIYEQRPRTQSNDPVPNRLYYNDDGVLTTPESADWNGIAAPDGFGAHSYTNMFSKHGGTAKLDWRPGGNFEASLFGFAYYSDEQETRNTNRVFNLNQHRDLTASTGTANIRGVDSQWRYNDFNRDQMGIQASARWDLQERGALSADFGRSRAWYRSDRPFVTFVYNPNTRLSYDMADRSFVPVDGQALLDPSNYSNRNTYRDTREAHSYVSHGKLDYRFNNGAGDYGFGFATGLDYRAMDMERDNTATYYLQRQSTLEGISFSPDFDIPGYSWPALWLDADTFWKQVIPGMQIDQAQSLYSSLVNDYRYSETTLAGYVDASWASHVLRISGGLRVDRTEFDARMARAGNGVILDGQARADGGKTEVLPFVNAIWSLSPEVRIKASASQTLGRPNPEMIATVESRNDDELTVSRGNPSIRPRQSSNLDLGVEYYFNDGLGMLTATVFHKDISDDILNVSWQEQIDGEAWTVTAPVNGEDTTYQGLELGLVNSSFEALGPALAPLGASLNMMLVEGESSYLYNGQPRSLDQLQYQSEIAGNTALFWSFDGGSEVRLSVNHQGEYLEEFAADPWMNIRVRPFTTVDLAAKWNVTAGLQLRVEGRNILGAERARTTGPRGDLFRTDLEVGSTWFASLSYRY